MRIITDSGKEFNYTIDPNQKVIELKSWLEQKTGIPKTEIRLLYNKKELLQENTFQEYELPQPIKKQNDPNQEIIFCLHQKKLEFSTYEKYHKKYHFRQKKTEIKDDLNFSEIDANNPEVKKRIQILQKFQSLKKQIKTKIRNLKNLRMALFLPQNLFLFLQNSYETTKQFFESNYNFFKNLEKAIKKRKNWEKEAQEIEKDFKNLEKIQILSQFHSSNTKKTLFDFWEQEFQENYQEFKQQFQVNTNFFKQEFVNVKKTKRNFKKVVFSWEKGLNEFKKLFPNQENSFQEMLKQFKSIKVDISSQIENIKTVLKNNIYEELSISSLEKKYNLQEENMKSVKSIDPQEINPLKKIVNDARRQFHEKLLDVIKQTSDFKMNFCEIVQKMNQTLLYELERFNKIKAEKNFNIAYQSFVVEIYNRNVTQKMIENSNFSIANSFEEEINRREKFQNDYSQFLPKELRDILIKTAVPQFKIELQSVDQENLLPSLSLTEVNNIVDSKMSVYIASQKNPKENQLIIGGFDNDDLQFQQELQKIKKEKDELKSKLDEENINTQNLNQELEQSRMQISNLNNEIKPNQEKIDQLTEKINLIQEQKNKEIEEIQTKLKEKDQEIQKYLISQEEFERIKRENQELKTKLTQEINSTQNLNQELVKSKMQISNLNNEIKPNQEKIDQLTQKINLIQEQKNKEIEEIQTKLKEKDQEIQKYLTSQEEFERIKRENQELKTKLTQEINSTQNLNQELVKSKMQISNLNNEIKPNQEKIDQLTEKINLIQEEKNKEIEEIQKKLKEKEQETPKNIISQEEFERIKRENQEFNQKMKQIEKEKEEAIKKNQEMENQMQKKDQRINKLKELQEKFKKISRERSHLIALVNQIKKLYGDENQMKEPINVLSEFDVIKELFQQKQKKANELETKLEKISNEKTNQIPELKLGSMILFELKNGSYCSIEKRALLDYECISQITTSINLPNLVIGEVIQFTEAAITSERNLFSLPLNEKFYIVICSSLFKLTKF
ncbi:rb1-inducible coiled-coil protein [Anaeramoeba ignava]|uniref:Rb1-inducible coiled-coil protein n=1 Tax=Anaeramoeba ignava TaxID=1746090 RepID=A0A9Q0LIY6_ANAIG|nr:rb1-inducible coiled-coil protein [Anaeramoeba ignava]